MDIPRKTSARKRIIKRIVLGLLAAAAIGGITLGLSRLKPAAPTVERSTVWVDSVKRGPMLRDVRGLGTLVPEDVMWVPAMTDGRIERILVLPGAQLRPDTILMELSNPDLVNQTLTAEYDLKSAEAAYTDLKVKLESANLTQQADAAKVESDFVQAKLRADTDESLVAEHLTPEITAKLSRSAADELENRRKIEQKRLQIAGESIQAQLDAQKVQVEQKRALLELKRTQVQELKIRAGTDGVLQSLGVAAGAAGNVSQSSPPIEVGQRVTAGTLLAKVAQPWKLKAELKIAETQAKDILLGQKAEIDTRNGIIPGRVVRIDPAAVNGTVTVDVKLEGKLPQGARPDLSVDGTIELERLTDVVYVGRPVFGQQQSLVQLFKLDPDGRGAARVQVKLGRASVNTIEILEGLRVGDQVVLSDMSAWDSHDRIRLN